MNKIFITTSSFATYSLRPLELLDKSKIDYKINSFGRKLFPDEIRDLIKDCDGVIAGTENYNKELLDNLPKLRIISRLGVGTDNISLNAASMNKIAVYTTQTSPAPAVAELVLGLIISLLRKIHYQNNLMISGEWIKIMGSLLQGKTLGILGLGNIGKKLVEITSGFNLNYLVFDKIIDKNLDKNYSLEYVPLEEVCKKSDIISIHLNLSKNTINLINHDLFKLMKKDVIIINTSRGEIINENALIKSLDNKNIGGAGLDVFSKEPYKGKLTNYNNVITTPHIGAYAKEIRSKMEMEATENLINGFFNG